MATSTTLKPATFAPQKTFAVGSQPISLGVADVNNDGNADVITANTGASNVSVLIGNGRGNFAPQTTFAVDSRPYSMSIADVNHDGNADVVTANVNSNNVSVLVGDGRGNFAAQKTFSVGIEPISVNVADVNNDGNADVVTANGSGGNVSVLLGDGRGNFATQITFRAGTYPVSVSIGDLNDDSNADVVIGDGMSNDVVSVLLGDGKGNFSDPTTFAVGESPVFVSIVDMDGDGNADVVTANIYSDNVSVLLGDGRGSFEAQTAFSVGTRPRSVSVADVNGDGKLDLVTANKNYDDDNNKGSVSILLGDKRGNFAAQTTFAVGLNPLSVSVADVNNDGKLDLITANIASNDISVLLNTTEGTFVAPSKPAVVKPAPTYALTVTKSTVNEGDTVTFNLTTENVAADTEIPFKFGGTISNADVLGGLKTSRFVVDSNGKSSLAVKFLADKLTEGAENLTLTLNSGESQSVAIKDTSLTPVIVKPITETPTGSKGYDKKAIILSGDKLIGGEKNDTLTGNVGKDELLGKAGNDKLIGLGGNDTLIGESGNDNLSGGEGLDSLSGSSGNDLLDGGNGNDTLIGDQGNDTLKGGFGVDSMDGGEGDDYYFVDNSRDVVSESNKNGIGGNDTIESTSTYTLGKNIENLVLAGIDNNAGKGNELNNQITGNIGDNKLEGMAGNDKLIGKDGADTLNGGKGTDTLIGGNDDDIYIINNDFDTVIEEKNGGEQDQIRASVDYDLSRSLFVEVLTLSGAAITGVGDDANNLLMEIDNGKIANHFVSNGGNDTILSEGGNDTIEGGAGDDNIDGGDGTQDIAIFYSKKENYQITRNPDAEGVDQITVRYVGNGENGEIDEGTDSLTNIELLQFADFDENNPIHTDTITITGLSE